MFITLIKSFHNVYMDQKITLYPVHIHDYDLSVKSTTTIKVKTFFKSRFNLHVDWQRHMA